MEVWDNKNITVEKITASGNGALSGVLDNSSMSDQGSGVARIPMTGHGFDVGAQIFIQGSNYYDGLHTILAVNDTDTFDINMPQLMTSGALPAEEFAGTEFCGVAIYNPCSSYKFVESRLHLSNTSADEAISMTLDSHKGAFWDVVIKSENINGETSWDWAPAASLYYNKADVLKFAYANTNTRDWGIELIFEVRG